MAMVAQTGRAGESVRPRAKTKERIGVYDSRAIAVAFAGSKIFNKWMFEQKAELQKLMHNQGFSTAPMDNILEQIKDRLPAIKEKAGVGVLVSKWDKDTLAKHPSDEFIDVTRELVGAFNPNGRQRTSVIEIQKHKPI